MAWPSEFGSISAVIGSPYADDSEPQPRHAVIVRPPLVRFYSALRGKYRVFNTAEYRFYRSSTGPPKTTDTPFATNATLPHEPADTYGDGTWWLSVSFFNGVIDSGFLPIGPNGETFLRLDISGGVATNAPPNGPLDWRLVQRPNGVIRVLAWYYQPGTLRADTWALTYTTDGSLPGEPPAVSPTETVALAAGGVVALSHDLPAQGDGTTVRVRLQTRRLDSANVYSERSRVLTATADAAGPTAPVGMDRWAGAIPEDA